VYYIDVKNLNSFFFKVFKKLLCVAYLKKGHNSNIKSKQKRLSVLNNSKRTSKGSNIIYDDYKELEADQNKENGNSSEEEQKDYYVNGNRGRRSYNFLTEEENMLEEL
jgi:hypothetical protein